MFLVLSIVWMPLGWINLSHRVNPRIAGVAGALSGLASATVLNWPDFEPIGAAIFITALAGFVLGVGAYIGIEVSQKIKDDQARGGGAAL
jgi:hypothetical protein